MKKSVLVLLVLALAVGAAEPVKVLIVDGRNNHDWIKTTRSLVGTLNDAGRFEIGVSTTPIGVPRG